MPNKGGDFISSARTPSKILKHAIYVNNQMSKSLPFFGDKLLHSRPTDCHKVKSKPQVLQIQWVQHIQIWAHLSMIKAQDNLPREANIRKGPTVIHEYFFPTATLMYVSVLAKKISRKRNKFLLLIAYCILHVLILHNNLNCFIHLIAFIVNPYP